MGKGCVGQISMEYLLIVAFAFLLLVPIIFIAFTQSARFSTDVTGAQVEKVGTELVNAANEVYYAGPPTKRTIKLYFPQGIASATIANNTIIFLVQGSHGQYEYVASAATNLSGEIRSFSGVHTMTLTAGEKNVTIEDN